MQQRHSRLNRARRSAAREDAPQYILDVSSIGMEYGMNERSVQDSLPTSESCSRSRGNFDVCTLLDEADAAFSSSLEVTCVNKQIPVEALRQTGTVGNPYRLRIGLADCGQGLQILSAFTLLQNFDLNNLKWQDSALRRQT